MTFSLGHLILQIVSKTRTKGITNNLSWIRDAAKRCEISLISDPTSQNTWHATILHLVPKSQMFTPTCLSRLLRNTEPLFQSDGLHNNTTRNLWKQKSIRKYLLLVVLKFYLYDRKMSHYLSKFGVWGQLASLCYCLLTNMLLLSLILKALRGLYFPTP